MLSLSAGTWDGAHTARAHGAGDSNCAVLGVYRMGPTIPPPIVRPPAGSGQSTARPNAAIVYPILGGGTLAGIITLTASTTCGTPTRGSFSVALSRYRGPLPMTPGSGSSSTDHQITRAANLTAALPISASTTVLTATGTFSQDTSHSDDSAYVSVDATVTYGRAYLACPPLCGAQPKSTQAICVPNGCRPGETVSRVSTFRDVTGYLALSSGKPATLALVFLPPPDPKAAGPSAAISALQPISLLGTRVGGLPRTG
ncbi:MAG: hypothetical protein ACRDG4_09080 [Chloroflexota bacterium]